MNIDMDILYETACRIAREGGDHTLQYFRKKLDVVSKSDQSPVTIADRETEQLMRKSIQASFPDHGIIGEEYESVNEDSEIVWILDPIDGTKSFIHGIDMYTTLLGVVINNEPVIGIIYAPATGEFCSACKGKGTLLNGEAVKVKTNSCLSEATLLTTDMDELSRQNCEENWAALSDAGGLQRTWGDAYGHMMVACGRADVMFDPILNLWDAAPLLTIVSEAGGCFFDRQGAEDITTGSAISTTPALKSEVMAHLCSA